MLPPLVSCIMPTNNRRAFVPYAITYFLQQDYTNKELLVVDDGTDAIEDIIPAHKQIRYIRLQKKMTLGEKRNYCIKESKADLIMHWDDDDWMAPYRISYQVQELLKHNAEVCGLQQMLFRELATGKCWLYKYPPQAQPWLAGGSLLYTRNFWQKSPFPDMQVASDTRFIFARKLTSFVSLPNYHFYVASIHSNNTSAKNTKSHLWQPVESAIVKNIIEKYDSSVLGVSKIEPIPPVQQVVHKTRVAILITTCNRALLLKQIINHLKKEADTYDLQFFIVDDSVTRNGKKGYWKTINALWSQVKGLSFDFYIQLQDDVELKDRFIRRAIESWQNIDDPKKICLNLILDGLRLGKTCWTNFWPQLTNFKGKRYLNSQWLDMIIFICEKRFFEKLEWSINPINPDRWIKNPELSSGVGQQISTRLHHTGWHLYQITENICDHNNDNSIMHPEVRKKEPLKSAQLSLIYAGLASVPERENQLKNTIVSIIPYVDQLYLFLNDYNELPKWISSYKKIIPFLSSKEKTNMGDAGKFFGLNKILDDDFYYFTIDDDMIYPPDYVWKMVERVERYKRKAIVGCGGYIMKPVVNQFYKDRYRLWHYKEPNTQDRLVHILYSGLAAWHSSAIQFKYEDCKKANMADIWLAIAAQKKQVPMVVIDRPANWVLDQPLPIAKTIYGKYRNNCYEQTTIYNSWTDWKVIEVSEKKFEYTEL